MRDRIPDTPLLVLAACVSASDRHWVERTLKDAGFEVRVVLGAQQAGDEIDGHPGSCVLVIDSGFLHMPRDSGWRDIRARHPKLGVVIRCVIAEDPGIAKQEGRTFLVHPDCGDRLLEAVRAFRASAPAG